MIRKLFVTYCQLMMVLMPIFVFPFTTDTYGFGKTWLVLGAGILGMGLWVMDFMSAKEKVVKLNFGWWMLLAFNVIVMVGWFRLDGGTKMRALMTPTAMGWWLAGLVWLFLWLQSVEKGVEDRWLYAMTVAGVILGIVSLVVFLLPAARFPIVWPTKDNPLITINNGWSLAGSLVAELLLLLYLVLEWVKKLMVKLESGDYLVALLITAFLVLVLALDGYRIYRLGWVALDFGDSWVVATEALKRSPFFGVGAGNYINAFSWWRPIGFNLGKYWDVGFSQAGMGWLTVWTELGIGGLLLSGWWLRAWLRKRREKDFLLVGTFLLAFLLLPNNLMGLLLLAWVMASKWGGVKEVRPVVIGGERGYNLAPYILSLVVVAGGVFGGYWWSRILLGEIYQRRALVAAVANRGTETYQQQINAIGQNPNWAEYRRLYSQTNIALALNILKNKDSSDKDREQASVLVQQAVREAKAAVGLEQTNGLYWSNLAAIYRSLVGVVDGSYDWSLQAFSQAVAIDPMNPNLKIDLGGLLYAGGRYEEADRVFEQVVNIRPNFANGWYNWAYSAKKLNKLKEAVSRMAQTLVLVPVESGDYDKANAELTTWRKELEELERKQREEGLGVAEETKQETLRTAEPLPTGVNDGVKVVPDGDLEPPKVTVSPTVTPKTE